MAKKGKKGKRPPLDPAREAPEDPSFVIRFKGGLADDSALALDDYATSLAGWCKFIALAMRIALDSNEDTARLRVDRVLRLRVRVERRGSWETIVSIAWDVIPNAAWDVLKLGGAYAGLKFLKWCMRLAKRHANVKMSTADVERIAEALEALVAEEGLTLSPAAPVDPAPELFPTGKIEATEVEEYELAPDVPRRRTVVDALDQSLKEAVKPIGNSCTDIEIAPNSNEQETYLVFGSPEKQAIDKPLEVAPTRRDWEPAKIKFVRINRKTGRALFYFADDPKGEDNIHYSVILDAAVRRAQNVFTEAFSKDAPIDVYLKHGRGETGSVRTAWQITAEVPARGLLAISHHDSLAPMLLQ